MSSSTYQKKGATIVFTPTTAWSGAEKLPSQRELERGYSPNIDRLSMSGKSVTGRASNIATIKVTADSGRYFISAPKLSKASSGRFRLKSKGVKKTIKKAEITLNQRPLPTEYLFELIYSAKGKTTQADNKKARIVFETRRIPIYSTSINKITFGSTKISPKGEIRTINIYGTAGSSFGIAINENQEEVLTDAGGLVDNKSYFDKTEDVSILGTFNTTDNTFYGKDLNVLKGKIPRSGVYSFRQKFPSIISLQTSVDGSRGSGNKHVFRETAGVKVGDRIFCAGIIPTTTTVLVTHINPDGNNVNELQFDTSINLTNKKPVRFERKKIYSIDLIPDLTSTRVASFPKTNPPYRLVQKKDTTLTITNKTDDANMRINTEVGVDRTAALDYSISYSGTANKLAASIGRNKTNSFSVSLILSTVNSETFTGATKFGLDNTNQSISSFTNSVPEFNGGTRVSVSNMKYGALAAQTLTVSYDVKIIEWGDEDVEMVIDWDALTAHSGD